MKSIRCIKVLLPLVLFVAIVSLYALPDYMSLDYLKRCLAWGPSDVEDYKRFPCKTVNNASTIFYFNENINSDLIDSLSKNLKYKYRGQTKVVGNMERFLQDTNTTAFIIIKDDNILYEDYFNGYSRDSINTSFSVAKSFLSVLIGIAIDEGYIKSVDDAVSNYIPELKEKGFDQVSIKDLLTMASGIKYNEYYWITGDNTKTYYSTDLRGLALKEISIKEPIGQHFHYNNYHPLLLGLILERATGKSAAQYLEEKIWKPLGMEYTASWSIDSLENGFEKLESGINARAIDYAKFGKLLLNQGTWNGKQIVSKDWIAESTKADFSQNRKYYEEAWFYNERVYYKYFWYSYPRNESNYDFFAAGHLGQYIYLCPQKNLIIIRNGSDDGKVDFWPELFYNLSEVL